MDKKFNWKPKADLGKKLKILDVLDGSGLVRRVSEPAMHIYLNFVAGAINRRPEIRDDLLSEISDIVDAAVRSTNAEGQENLQGLDAQIVALNFYLIRLVNGRLLPDKSKT